MIRFLVGILVVVVNTIYADRPDDEMEHVKTMVACQQPNAQVNFHGPHTLQDDLNLPL